MKKIVWRSLAAVIIGVIIVCAVGQWYLTANYQHTKARIIEVQRKPVWSHRTSIYYKSFLSVKFYVDGNEIVSVVTSRHRGFEPGDYVEISYSKNNPQKCFLLDL
jgi:hypothetical protein